MVVQYSCREFVTSILLAQRGLRAGRLLDIWASRYVSLPALTNHHYAGDSVPVRRICELGFYYYAYTTFCSS